MDNISSKVLQGNDQPESDDSYCAPMVFSLTMNSNDIKSSSGANADGTAISATDS